MADQRGIDLTWGQLGEATYDTVEKKWSFLRQSVLPNLLQPIQPLKECLPASLSTGQEETKDDNVREVTRRRKDWRTSKALQTFSDLGGAASFLKTLELPKEEEEAKCSTTGGVMATGVAKLRSVTNKGYRAFPVIAASYGAEGHVLRISKPRIEDHTWTNHTDDKIRLLNMEKSEHGYWSDGAAAIEQVTFAIDIEGLQTWLAVRHAASTTILRPLVHPLPVAQNVPNYMLSEYPPSRIDANMACTITTQVTRGRSHVDVAFNPWYTRQFAILDDAGYWKTWNIEGIHAGPKKAVKGKSGCIYDDQGLHDAAPKPENAGWGRIIWVSDVGTIVVCNLRHVAMFAIGREITKLKCPQVIPKGSNGRILDMKRSPVWHDKFFILTDTRLYLLDTMAAGCQLIMSTPHFREAQSADLKLELHGRHETCTALLYSSNTGLVNVFNFKLDTEAPTPVTWTTDSFYLPETDKGTPAKNIQELCILPATESPGRWNKNKDGRWYNPNQFYQAFTLSKDFAISQTLLAEGDLVAGPAADKPAIYETVGGPDTSKFVPEKIRTAKKKDERVDELLAIVPDGLPEDIIRGPPRPNFWEMKKAAAKPEVLQKKPDAVNAQAWHELATAERLFHCDTAQGHCRGHASPRAKPCDGENLQDGDVVMADYVQKIIAGVQRRKDVEQQGLTTLRDLAEYSRFTEDIDDGAQYLAEFVGAFEDNDESSSVAINLRASDVSNILESASGKAAEGAMTDLSRVYDKVVGLYLASLPAETPGEVRIAKERMARNIAADLALSSLMVHVKEKPNAPESQSTNLSESFKSSQFTQSQAMGSQRSHLPSATPDPNLPSSQPSIDGGMTEQYSQLLTPDPSIAGSQVGESAEDPSISLLRSYAVHVKTQKPLGKTRADIIDTWKLGSDINTFRWKAPDLYGTVEVEEEDEHEAIAKKEREQRREHKERRKMEKEMRRQHRYSMLPSQENFSNSPIPSGVESQRKGKRKSLGGFGSQFSQSQTPGFGTPIVQKKSRKSMGAFPWQSQGGGWGGEGGSQTPMVSVSTGTPVPRPGTSAATSFGASFGAASQGGVDIPQIGVGTRPGAASQGTGAGQSFGTSFASSQGGPMTQPVQGAFGGRRSMGGRQSFGRPEKKRRKGF